MITNLLQCGVLHEEWAQHRLAVAMAAAAASEATTSAHKCQQWNLPSVKSMKTNYVRSKSCPFSGNKFWPWQNCMRAVCSVRERERARPVNFHKTFQIRIVVLFACIVCSCGAKLGSPTDEENPNKTMHCFLCTWNDDRWEIPINNMNTRNEREWMGVIESEIENENPVDGLTVSKRNKNYNEIIIWSLMFLSLARF